MLTLTAAHHQIRWIIVSLVTVYVVDYFTFPQWPSNHLLSHHSVCMPAVALLIGLTLTLVQLSHPDLFPGLWILHPVRIELSVHVPHVALSAAEMMLRSLELRRWHLHRFSTFFTR